MAGNVKSLDTVNFNDIMAAFSNYITQFEDIVRGVNSAASSAVDSWKGKGSAAFDKDYRLVQRNLDDISDIMYDLREALVDAHAEYIKTDSALSKSFES